MPVNILLLTFWRGEVNHIQNEEQLRAVVLMENPEKVDYVSLKKRRRRMHVVFALLLLWCLTVFSFFLYRGVPPLPTYAGIVEQAFPVRLLIMGWEQREILETYPSKLSDRQYRRVPAHDPAIIIPDHLLYEGADAFSVLPHNNLSESEAAAIKSLSNSSFSVSSERKRPTKSIIKSNAQITVPSVIINSSTSNRQEVDGIHSRNYNKKKNKIAENIPGKRMDDQKPPPQLNAVTDQIPAFVDLSAENLRPNDHGVGEQNSGRDLKGQGDQMEQKNTELEGINQEPAEIKNYSKDQRKPSDDADQDSAQVEEGMNISCNRNHWRTDVCVVEGDVRVKGQSVELHVHAAKWNEKPLHVVEVVKPYTRKWEMPLMLSIDQVRIENVLHADDHSSAANLSSNQTSKMLNCNTKHSVPAIIFSTGGYTGNVYHDFSDGLIPLYITSRHLHGEVIFLVLDFHEWWLYKYGGIIRQLSNYPIVDLRRDADTVRCFPEVTIGLKIHDELSINSDQMANEGSSQDFHTILDQAFTPLEHSSPSHDVMTTLSPKIPKLVLIARKGSRSISNQKQVVDLAKRVGFEVEVIEPHGGSRLEDIFMHLNACDAMMGVHGAAMTHLLFMRPSTIFIQIIPLGTDGPAFSFYGEPAMKMGLDYIEYKVKTRESSLSKQYQKNDKVLTNPAEIVSKGWLELKKYYLDGQSVRLHLPRLKLTLEKALRRIKRRSLRHSHSRL